MSVIVEILAKNPPSIAIALAGILALIGQTGTAVLFLVVGSILQILWLVINH